MAFSQHCWIILAIVLLSTTLSPSRVTAEEVATESVTPPNIVFLLVDDLGWADLGYNGSRFHKTPNINALAESGMRFNQGYAACPVCSPTRASILTGRHPVRVDITDWIPGATNRHVANPRFGVLQDRD
ncbi:MAG: sulfatase-like hydrolase/transferase, partial [Planctomycetota bacterium]